MNMDHQIRILQFFILIVIKYLFRVNGWKRAQNYTESDIGFLIFTAAIFYHTRATAIRDTWLSRVTHKYFLSATPYSWLPLTLLKEQVKIDYLI